MEKNLKVTFKQGLLHEAFRRLDNDALFRKRQLGSVLSWAHSVLKASGLIHALRYLPPAISTPMIFEMWASD